MLMFGMKGECEGVFGNFGSTAAMNKIRFNRLVILKIPNKIATRQT